MELSKKNVLVIDDDPVFAEMVADHLNSLGYRASTAWDAKQALIQAEGLLPLIIVTDINMPIWGSGIDAYKKIRQHRRLKKVPVIFVTSLKPESVKDMMPDDPGVRLLFKPLDMQLLERSIRELTGNLPQSTPT